MTALDRDQLRNELESWAKNAILQFGASSIYVFGSFVYKDGTQLVASSDIDLLVLFPQKLEEAYDRFSWLINFRKHKKALEVVLLSALDRRTVEPFASLIVATELEITLGIHKDNLPDFFDVNTFLNLSSGVKQVGLGSAKSKLPPDRFRSAALGFTQNVRNKFLSVMANDRSNLQIYDGEDPIPKASMRASAMARASISPNLDTGAEYDTKEGLDFFSNHLYSLKEKDGRYTDLQNLVSERRLARGPGGPISMEDQLLISEIIHDLATSKVRASVSSGSAEKKLDETAAKSESPLPIYGRGFVSSKLARGDDMLESFNFFQKKFQNSFPGVRKIEWFSGQEAIKRLTRLFSAPLDENGYYPIWWWRGGNLNIKRFMVLENDVILLNNDELKIKRIAACPGASYKHSFVYLESYPMEPTGLYNHNDTFIRERIARHGYADEEYGLLDGHKINRGEYDDGAALINNEIVDTVGAELRNRYISAYNIIIAPQASPINNPKFDSRLVGLMNMALQHDAESQIEDLANQMKLLPLRP